MGEHLQLVGSPEEAQRIEYANRIEPDLSGRPLNDSASPQASQMREEQSATQGLQGHTVRL